jgi:hypothetical protein
MTEFVEGFEKLTSILASCSNFQDGLSNLFRGPG